MAYEQIAVDIQDQVATITLNRPEKLSAYTATHLQADNQNFETSQGAQEAHTPDSVAP